MPDRFATILTCIDGRIQRPLDEWTREYLGVDFVDTITEPGPESAVVSDDGLAALMAKVRVSQDAHGSQVLVIAGHSDCAGNPVSDDEHRRQLRAAATRLAAHLPGTRILALHADTCGTGCWAPTVVAEVAVGATATD